jgi:hypothetical protein
VSTETARSYSSKSKRLNIVAETVLQDINSNFSSSAGELQRLIPIQRCACSCCLQDERRSLVAALLRLAGSW